MTLMDTVFPGVMQIDGDVLCLHDIVAAELPPLDEILRRQPAPVRRVEL
ncbi:hypothetical protein WMF18_07415 [Sorangium sp. So ce315]